MMETEQNKKEGLIFFLLILAILFVGGMLMALFSPKNSLGIFTAYAAGTVMVLTPCALPLILLLTTSVTNKSHKRGIGIGLSFTLGFAVIAAILGGLMAFFGEAIELPNFNRWVFGIGGILLYLYATSEVIHIRIPWLNVKLSRLQWKNEYMGAFLVGVMTSIGDVGCPNPLRFLLLSFIATSRHVVTGLYLGFIYGVGAIIPLLFFALLSLFGYNAAKAITKYGAIFEQIFNITLIPIGAFLSVYGLFGSAWYENEANPIHRAWENILKSFNLISPHSHGTPTYIYALGNVVVVGLIILPLIFRLRHTKIRKSGEKHNSA